MMAIDENGISDLKHVKKQVRDRKLVSPDQKYFTVTGAIFDMNEYARLRDNLTSIKFKYWENGECLYNGSLKRVHFHSREIRKRRYPFDIDEYESFLSDLTHLIQNTSISIITSTIDKERHVQQYRYPAETYSLSMMFVIERYAYFLRDQNKDGFIMLESRGKKEDKKLHAFIVDVLRYGTDYKKPIFFSNIKGVYFNSKWSKQDNDKKSYVGLELADLISYPIYRAFAHGAKGKDYKIIEPKIYGYPYIHGKGLKVFPK